MNKFLNIRQVELIQRYVRINLNRATSRGITTSKNNSESVSSTTCPNEEKNWVSYGFDYESKTEDTNVHHASYFFSVTLCLVFGGFFYAYAPDTHLRDWSQREAFLELRRRERACLPPIDPNYIDPAKMQEPTDEDVEKVGIII